MDNMYNVDAAIHYILQLIYVAEETGFFFLGIYLCSLFDQLRGFLLELLTLICYRGGRFLFEYRRLD